MNSQLPLNDISNWRVEDSFPELRLEEILPISARAMSLIVRRKDMSILSEAFLQLFGSVEMMQGMDYHHDRFMGIIQTLRCVEPCSGEARKAQEALNHEAVGYVNRLGQFFYFATSKLVLDRLSAVEQAIPKISELKIFRMKHSAHRSIDKPWPEDTPHLRTVHAMSLSTLGGGHFHPKEPCFSCDPRILYTKCYLGYQLNMGAAGYWDLVIERDHPICMREAYALLEKLLS